MSEVFVSSKHVDEAGQTKRRVTLVPVKLKKVARAAHA